MQQFLFVIFNFDFEMGVWYSWLIMKREEN